MKSRRSTERDASQGDGSEQGETRPRAGLEPSYARAVRLSGIFIYPIKACAGISLEHADVVERGLSLDRRYMLVDRAGTFVTQRQVSRLCLAKTALDGTSFVVSATGHPPLELPQRLEPGTLESRAYEVWGYHGPALRHEPGSRWFSEFLDDDVSLLYMPDQERRPVNPSRARPGDVVSFADGYPLLVISEASLADLNSRLAAPLEMRRFRPNLVLADCEPYAEDHFTSLRVGEVSFRAVKRCDRCVVTTIDPDTGERGREPLRTLASYRLEDGKVWFGMNLIHDGPGHLALGDAAHGQ